MMAPYDPLNGETAEQTADRYLWTDVVAYAVLLRQIHPRDPGRVAVELAAYARRLGITWGREGVVRG